MAARKSPTFAAARLREVTSYIRELQRNAGDRDLEALELWAAYLNTRERPTSKERFRAEMLVLFELADMIERSIAQSKRSKAAASAIVREFNARFPAFANRLPEKVVFGALLFGKRVPTSQLHALGFELGMQMPSEPALKTRRSNYRSAFKRLDG